MRGAPWGVRKIRLLQRVPSRVEGKGERVLLCTFPEAGHSVFLAELRAISSRVESGGTRPLWVLRVLRRLRHLWGQVPHLQIPGLFSAACPLATALGAPAVCQRQGPCLSAVWFPGRPHRIRPRWSSSGHHHHRTSQPPTYGRVARATPGQRSAVSDRTVTEGRDHTVGTTHGLQESCFPDDWLWTTPVRC